jgi:GT2 family glycosyltransferase
MKSIKGLVTIAIPVFNGENEIRYAIESVLSQDYQDFELLIIDDCSSDKTLEIAQSFSDRRIRIFRNETNLGYQRNFDRCVAEASGEYLKILCHDDVLLAGTLQLQVNSLEKSVDKSVVLCTGLKRIVDPQGKQIFPHQGLFGNTRQISGRKAIQKCVKAGRNLIGETSVVLAPTEAYRRAGNFRETYCLDLDMWVRILLTGDVFFINAPMSDFRLTAQSGTSKQKSTHAIQTINFFRKIDAENPGLLSPSFLLRGRIRAHLNQRVRQILMRLAVRR